MFQLFKYTVYCLLAYNAFLFFLDDHAASSQTFREGVDWFNVVEAYSASIDTTAWVILLLMFELETYLIPEEKIKGVLKWSLNLIRTLSYFFIVYAFYGYLMKYLLVHDVIPFVTDPCTLVGTSFTYIISLDDYLPMTAESCLELAKLPLYQVNGTEIIGAEVPLQQTQRQAFVDVVNSADWLLIVLILELDVFLQFKETMTSRQLKISKWIKITLYSVLFINAIYWGVEGTFLDFWDAFLWLVAFIFIEMNIFAGREEEDLIKEEEDLIKEEEDLIKEERT